MLVRVTAKVAKIKRDIRCNGDAGSPSLGQLEDAQAVGCRGRSKPVTGYGRRKRRGLGVVEQVTQRNHAWFNPGGFGRLDKIKVVAVAFYEFHATRKQRLKLSLEFFCQLRHGGRCVSVPGKIRGQVTGVQEGVPIS